MTCTSTSQIEDVIPSQDFSSVWLNSNGTPLNGSRINVCKWGLIVMLADGGKKARLYTIG